jgi:DNA-binding CsgD family transcriptional regulator
MSRRYTHVQELLPEIKAMLSEGRSQREIAEHLGLRDKNVVKDLLK